MKKRVSEIVTIADINSWDQGDIITIKAGTGAGKSYFIKNNLYAIAKRDNKKILMLIHRTNCTEQFLKEIRKDQKDDVIDIKTYQSIEAVERSGMLFELEKYDYIIADEWHYFFSDAAFNKYTDLSLKAILKTKSIKIFMSATSDTMKHFLTDKKHLGLETVDYELPIDFNFIKKLQFFYKDNTLEEYVRQAIELNKKAIFFIQSAKTAYDLHEKYKEYSMFVCSKSNKLYKHVDAYKIDNLLKNEKFDDLILFTTSCLDAGLNIIDKDLYDIVCDIKDIGSLVQCIGRKRLQHKDDYINLYVKAIGNQELGGRETQARNKINLAIYFIKNGEKKLVKSNYRKLNDNMIYDEVTDIGIEKRLNKLMFFKALADIREIEKIKSISSNHSYCRYITEEVFNLGHFSLYEVGNEMGSLERYLNDMVGQVMLQVKDRVDLIEKMNVRDGRNNRLLRSIDTLNGALKEMKLDYIIDQFETTRRRDGKKKNYRSAWRIRRLSD